MDIVSIFGKNLLSVKYPGEKKDEFARLFDLWHDAEELEEFFNDNVDDLNNEFWKSICIEDAIYKTFEYASEFEAQLIKLSKQSKKNQLSGLESIFKPLNNTHYQFITFGKSKAKANWLRIYALRIDRNTYIITGGAIKLTQKMQERDHTDIELKKIEKCRNYLLELGIVDKDGVIEEMES
jgi:hypothetical protein